eukprot:scaffold4102_cov174-Ochromonas_danica.AAC.6
MDSLLSFALLLGLSLLNLSISLSEVIDLDQDRVGDAGFCLAILSSLSQLVSIVALVGRYHFLCSNGNKTSVAAVLLLKIFIYSFTFGATFLSFIMCGTSLDEDRSNWLDRVQGGDRDNRSNLCVGIVQLMLCPLVFTVLFHKTMGKALGFLWLCCVSCLVALSVWRESVYLGVATVYYLAFSSLIVYEIISKSESEIVDRSLVSTFHEEVLQLHTQHMKTIVGNVAHDLKTPLSSFMAGVELVRELTEEVILKADESPTISNYSMKATLYSVLKHLRNMKDTNSFMLMTIHRCIDFVKSSRGLKLQPKLDTIDLWDSLHMPLTCMKAIQEHVSISVSLVDECICSHIITDKQWFQENLLCLLSNAVKYSAAGSEVTISITLAAQARIDERCNIDSASHMIPFSENSSNYVEAVRQPSRTLKANNLNQVSPSPIVPFHNNDCSSSMVAMPHEMACRSDAQHETSFIRIEVEDTGIGMTEEKMKTLFSAFQQAQRLAGGTGLGLFSMAKRLEALNGDCGVTSRRDGRQGSLFWFSFPYRPDAEAARLVDAEDRQNDLVGKSYEGFHRADVCSWSNKASSSSLQCPTLANSSVSTPLHLPIQNPTKENLVVVCTSRASSRRVLVVEDTLSISKIIKLMLEREGFSVVTANNGADGLSVILKSLEECRAVNVVRDNSILPRLPSSPSSSCHSPRHFDLILCDLQMPIMDGLEMVRRLRHIEQNEYGNTLHHTVIAISANNDSDVIQEARGCGFDEFIPKPFSLEAFLTVFEKFDA